MRRLLSTPLWLQTLFAMGLGIPAGLFLTLPDKALTLIAKLPIDLIKTFATPLLFFVIIEAIAVSKWPKGGLRRFFIVVGINATAAFVIGSLLTWGAFSVFGDFLHLGKFLPESVGVAPVKDWTNLVESLIPRSVIEPFAAHQVIAVVVLAILFGAALRAEGAQKVVELLPVAVQVLQKCLYWTVRLVPFAVFAAIAKSVSLHGLGSVARLLGYVALCVVGMTIHVGVVYQFWIRFVAKRRLGDFWRAAREPMVNSFGVNSSLVTLPLTLVALEKLKVSKASARLSAGIGTNFNNDGILLYEIVAALCLVFALEPNVGIDRVLFISLMGLMATLGVAGVPEAGLVALSLVVSIAGLPAEAIPLLIGVDWFVGRCRSVVNVLADMTVALAVDGPIESAAPRAKVPGSRHAASWLLAIASAGMLVSCSQRPPVADREHAMRAVSAPSSLIDGIDPLSFVAALRTHAERLRNKGNCDTMVFGERTVAAGAYATALEILADRVSADPRPEVWTASVREQFDFFEVYGDDKGWGQVLVTGYYEPELMGSRTKTAEFSQPLYRRPPDLVEVSLSKFGTKFESLAPMRGRVEKKGDKSVFVPYFSRQEIDQGNALAKSTLPIAYVDPIEAFWVQIQGSGTVVFADGKRMRIGYADQNGHPYQPIGKYLIGTLPKDGVTIPAIEAHLRSLGPKERRDLMFKNPSYVFFEERTGNPRTAFATDALAGRTVAVDSRYFPKGALAYLDVKLPQPLDPAIGPAELVPAPRFVFDADVGGAIRGGGRVDLYLGTGREAGRIAGVLKERGKLWYLVPKIGAVCPQ